MKRKVTTQQRRNNAVEMRNAKVASSEPGGLSPRSRNPDRDWSKTSPEPRQKVLPPAPTGVRRRRG